NPYPGVSEQVNENWQVLPNEDSNWIGMPGTNRYKVYVLNNPPAEGVTPFHTVARVGTLAAQTAAAPLVARIRTNLVNQGVVVNLDLRVAQEMSLRNTKYGFEDMVKQAVMNSFQTRGIQRADGKLAGAASAVLTYYGNWARALKNDTTAALL